MTVLQESKAFNTTIVGKQEMDSENFYNCNTPTDGHLQKANDELYIYRIKGTVVQGENVEEQLVFQQLMCNPVTIMYYQKGVYAVSMEIGPESKLHRGVANVGVKPTFTSS